MRQAIFLLTILVLFLNIICIAQDQPSGPMNEKPNLSKSLSGSINLSPSGDVVNQFSGTISFSIPVLPSVPLYYSSADVPKLMANDNKVMQSSWVGAGWSLELGSIIIDMHGTSYSANDAMYYLPGDGSRIQIVKDANDTLRLQNMPFKKVWLSCLGDQIQGIIIVNEDGSKMKFGDFQSGVGPGKANRVVLRGGNRLVTFPFDISGSVLNQICNRWDLSQVEDAYGHIVQKVSYFQEMENVTVSGINYAYTRASYPEYIINNRTNQKIHFVTSLTRDANEYEDVEISSNKLEFYEKGYLSSIEILSSSNVVLSSIVFNSAPILPNVSAPDRKKRILNSIVSKDRNNLEKQSTSFEYDPVRSYLLSKINLPSGGSTQITTESLTYSNYINQNTEIDNAGTVADDRYTSASSPTTIARYEKASGELRIYKWIGYWKKTVLPAVDRDDNPCYLQVADEHVVLAYTSTQAGSYPSALRVWDWDESSQNWIQSKYITSGDISPESNPSSGWYIWIIPALSQDGKYLGVLHVDKTHDANYGLPPYVQMYEWNDLEKSWNSLDGFFDDTPFNWDDNLTNFTIKDNLVLIDFKFGSHIWEWRKESTGIVWSERKGGSENGWEWREHFLNNEYKGMVDRGSGPSLIYQYKSGSDGWTYPVETPLGDFSDMYRTNICFNDDKIIMFENVEESAVVKIWNRTNSFFSTPQILWNGVGPEQPYRWGPHFGADDFEKELRRRFITINDDWAAVMLYNDFCIPGTQPYEGRIWLYKRNISNNTYEACGGTNNYFTYTANEAPWSTLNNPALIIMDNKLVILAPGRNNNNIGYYTNIGTGVTEKYPVRDGFVDMFNLDKENPGNWVNTRHRIIENFRDGDLLMGPNYIGVCSKSNGKMIVKMLHGIDNRDTGVDLNAYCVTKVETQDGMENTPQVNTYAYSSPIFDPSLTIPGFAHCQVSNNLGIYKTYFNNGITTLTELRLRGIPQRTEAYKPDGTTLVQQSMSTYSVYQDDSKWYLYQIRKMNETSTVDGITKTTSYEYNNQNGQIRKIIEDADANSDLYGKRDVVTEITYAFQENTAMRNANMLVQQRSKKVSAVTTDAATPVLMIIPSSISFGEVAISSNPDDQNYVISGTNLTPESGNINISAPSGFQVMVAGGSFGSTATIAYTGNKLTPKAVSVRFHPTAVQGYSGNITNSGGGAAIQNVAVSGVGIGSAAFGVINSPSLDFGNVIVNTISAESEVQFGGMYLSPASGTVTVKAPAGFKVSKTSGSGFADSITFAYSLGYINVTSFMVRFNPTSAQSYSGNIVISGGGASALNLPASGTGIGTITVSPTSLAFSNVTINTNSDEKTYSLFAAYLSPISGNITVTAPNGFQVSETTGSGFASSIQVGYSGGSITSKTMYVRFAPTVITNYSGNVSISGGGAAIKNVAVSGAGIGSAAFGLINSQSLDFGNVVVNTVSSESGLQFGGMYLSPASGTVTVKAPAGFQVSKTSGSGFADSITFSYSIGTLNVTNFSVRFTPKAAQSYSGNIVISGGGAPALNLPASGTGIGTITVSPTSLAFGNVTVNTISSEKTYTVTGANLSPVSGNITITAPSGYQVSTTSGSGFASSIQVGYSGGSITSKTMYVRFAPTVTTNYNGSITNSGGGAATQYVAVSGTGIGTPSLTVISPTSLSLGFGNVTVNTNSAQQSVTFAGSNLSPANETITVTAPTGYAVAKTSSGPFSSSINYSYTQSYINVTSFSVRFTPASAQNYRGNITISGGGATTSIEVIGTGIAVIPPTPTGFTATPGNCGTGTINLSWIASSGATRYIITDDVYTVYDGPNLSFPHTGLAPGSGHYYYITAWNSAGYSSPSNTIVVYAPNECIPPPPTGFTATPVSTTQVYLSWSSVPGASSYTLKNSSGTTLYSGSGTSYTNSGLTCGTYYYYYLTANNTGGSSSQVTASATMFACPPSSLPVTASASAGGTISPTSTTVSSGGSVTFTVQCYPYVLGFGIYLNGGYHSYISITPSPNTTYKTFTISNITSNTSVSVVFD